MRTTRLALPTLALATVFSLSACTTTEVSSKSPSDGAKSSASQPAPTSDSASQSPSSETSAPSSESSPTSSESSSSSSSSSSTSSESSPSSSDSASSGKEVTPDDLRGFAKTNTTRACKLGELTYMPGGAQYCKKDTTNFTSMFKGQFVYVTAAVELDPSSKYSYDVSMGSDSQSSSFENSEAAGAKKGDAVSLYVRVPVNASGTLKIVFKKDGKEFSTKSVQVSVD